MCCLCSFAYILKIYLTFLTIFHTEKSIGTLHKLAISILLFLSTFFRETKILCGKNLTASFRIMVKIIIDSVVFTEMSACLLACIGLLKVHEK